jgi:hypothetical protein
MKKALTLTASIAAFALPAAALAASGQILYNGGFGQLALNAQNFGIAVCNRGTMDMDQPIPITVSANGQTASVSSVNIIKADSCEYSYVPYAALAMQAGNSYDVNVEIGEGGDLVTYSIALPVAGVTTSEAQNTDSLANVGAQYGDFFTMLTRWLSGIFKQ